MKSQVRRSFMVLLSVMVVLGLVSGCAVNPADGEETPVSSNREEAIPSATPPLTYEPVDTSADVSAGDYEYTVSEGAAYINRYVGKSSHGENRRQLKRLPADIAF